MFPLSAPPTFPHTPKENIQHLALLVSSAALGAAGGWEGATQSVEGTLPWDPLGQRQTSIVKVRLEALSGCGLLKGIQNYVWALVGGQQRSDFLRGPV